MSAIKYDLQLDISPIVKGRTVAIVGHAASLYNHTHGAEIDSADIVVRFHLFTHPESVSRATGKRVDLWYVSDLDPVVLAHRSEIVNNKFNGVFVCGKKPGLLHRIKNNWNPVTLENLWPGKPGTWSGTGIVAVMDCLISGAASVKVYGFDFWESGDTYEPNQELIKYLTTKPHVIVSTYNDKCRLLALKCANLPVQYDSVLDPIIKKTTSPEGRLGV